MAKTPTDPEFYKRMLEAKKRKKEALEQRQLHAEFELHPERFESTQPIIVKTDAELRMDVAFQQLKEKLHGTTKADKFEQLVQRLKEQSEGL